MIFAESNCDLKTHVEHDIIQNTQVRFFETYLYNSHKELARNAFLRCFIEDSKRIKDQSDLKGALQTARQKNPASKSESSLSNKELFFKLKSYFQDARNTLAEKWSLGFLTWILATIYAK